MVGVLGSRRLEGGISSPTPVLASAWQICRYTQNCGIGLPVFISILDAHTAKLKGLKPIPTGGLMGYAYAENVWLEG